MGGLEGCHGTLPPQPCIKPFEVGGRPSHKSPSPMKRPMVGFDAWGSLGLLGQPTPGIRWATHGWGGLLGWKVTEGVEGEGMGASGRPRLHWGYV